MTLSARLPILDFGFSILDLESFDNSVCSSQDVGRNRQADLLRRLQVYDQLELRRLLHRKIGRLGAFQHKLDIRVSLHYNARQKEKAVWNVS